MNLKLEFKKEMEEEKLQKHVCACLCAKKQLHVRFSDGGPQMQTPRLMSHVIDGNLAHEKSQEL